MESYRRRGVTPSTKPSQPAPKPVPVDLNTLDWKGKFMAAFEALCKMEFRAESAEMEIERLTGRPAPWRR